MISNVIFDLYGTLVDIRTDETSEELWRAMSSYYQERGAVYAPETLKEKYHFFVQKGYFSAERNMPEVRHHDIDIREVFRALYLEKGIDPDNREITDTARFFREKSTLFIRLYDGIEELLRRLTEEGKRLILLSNAQSSFTLQELRDLGIKDFFDAIYISSDYGMAKPERAFLERVMEEHGILRDETILVGNDDVSDISMAAGAGLRTVYIRQEISPKPVSPVCADRAIMNGDARRIYVAINSLEEDR